MADDKKLNLLLSDFVFFVFSSSILSDPLCLFYLLFFSPYVFALFSFLSPVFLTTALLVAALLQDASSADFLARMGWWAPLHFLNGGPPIDVDEISEFVFGIGIEPAVTVVPAVEKSGKETPASPAAKSEVHPERSEEERKVKFLKILNDFERMASSRRAEEFSPAAVTKTQSGGIGRNSRVLTNRRASTSSPSTGTADKDSSLKSLKSHSDLPRREEERLAGCCSGEEWKRTLGGKLFLEREREEGMDSLWEAYEKEAQTNKSTGEEEANADVSDDGDDEEEDNEAAAAAGEVCCLLALKLSAGKMNRGVGRRSLTKISKALKGFRWLSKKIHNNGDK